MNPIKNKKDLETTIDEVRNFAYTYLEKHVELVLAWCKENLQNNGQTLAVRAKKIGPRVEGWSTRSIEQSIGGALFREGWKIDLTAPEITLKIIALNRIEKGENPPQII